MTTNETTVTTSTKPTLSDLLRMARLVKRIHEMREEGMLYRDINDELGLPSFTKGGGYRIMKTAFAKWVVKTLCN